MSAFDSAVNFIRPQDWTAALAQAYRISHRQARLLLRAAADEAVLRGEAQDLLSIWERAASACERYVLHRELVVGIMLGYYRWVQRPDGSQTIAPTARAQVAGLQRISEEIDAAIEATLGTEAEIALPDDLGQST